MMPVVFRIPLLGWDVPGYGLMLMLGFLLAVIWAARRAARSGANPDVILNCAFIALIGGVVGARTMYVVHYWEQYAARGDWLNVAWAIVNVRQGGLEVYGGFLAALLGTLVYLIGARHSVRWYLDIIAPSAALGMGIGRLGCFLNGCCWGTTCDLPWAIRFPFGSNAVAEQWYTGKLDLPRELLAFPPAGVFLDGRPAYPITRDLAALSPAEAQAAEAVLAAADSEFAALQARLDQAATPAERAKVQRELDQARAKAARKAGKYFDLRPHLKASGLSMAELNALARQYPSRPVHPAQLYSALGLILLALLLNEVYWRRTRDGQVIFTMLLIEPVLRFTLELLRADNPVDTLGHFTISQFLALSLSLVGLAGLLALRRMPPRSPRAVRWVPPEPPPPAPARRAAARR